MLCFYSNFLQSLPPFLSNNFYFLIWQLCKAGYFSFPENSIIPLVTEVILWVAYFMPLLFHLSEIVLYAVCYLSINCTMKETGNDTCWWPIWGFTSIKLYALVSFKTKYQAKILLEILSLESTPFKENKAIIYRQFVALSWKHCNIKSGSI